MDGHARATRIHEVGTVFVPVADQDRALAFYLEKLGFEKRVDFIYGGGHRWIEVAPPGAVNTIALVPPSEGKSAGSVVARCAFATKDIASDHAALRARGVEVDAEVAREGRERSGLVALDVTVKNPVPAQFFFRDLDGNRFLIVEAWATRCLRSRSPALLPIRRAARGPGHGARMRSGWQSSSPWTRASTSGRRSFWTC